MSNPISTKREETYQFSNLAELRDWLNHFQHTDLRAVELRQWGNNHVTLLWREKLGPLGELIATEADFS